MVGIADGDTLTLLTDRRERIRVRLAGIDSPETGQPFGARSRRSLSDLVFGKPVRVDVRGRDRYGRAVGWVRAGAGDVNAEMVRRGAAWVFRPHRPDPTLLRIERVARAERRGLWALPKDHRIPPWGWRAVEGQRR